MSEQLTTIDLKQIRLFLEQIPAEENNLGMAGEVGRMLLKEVQRLKRELRQSKKTVMELQVQLDAIDIVKEFIEDNKYDRN